MLRKTMLSKILSTAIAVITIVSPLVVSANPTSSPANEKETTTVSNQKTFANPDLISLSSAGKKRKSTEPILPPSPGKKIKFNQLNLNPRVKIPYNVEINLSNTKLYGYIDFCLNCKSECNPTNAQIESMKQFYTKLITITRSKNIKFLSFPGSEHECSLNDIINSNIMYFKIDGLEKSSLLKTLTDIIISVCTEMNIQFINIYLD